MKSIPDANQNDIWPRPFDFGHYGFSLQKLGTLPATFANSVLVTVSTVIITTVCAIMASYAMVFLQAPGIRLVFALLVASMFFPTRLTAIIAIFEIQKELGLCNVPAGLIIPYVTLSLALSVFVMRGMFHTVSHEIYDAARIDGAGLVRMLLIILLLMVKNGVVVVVILTCGGCRRAR